MSNYFYTYFFCCAQEDGSGHDAIEEGVHGHLLFQSLVSVVCIILSEYCTSCSSCPPPHCPSFYVQILHLYLNRAHSALSLSLDIIFAGEPFTTQQHWLGVIPVFSVVISSISLPYRLSQVILLSNNLRPLLITCKLLEAGVLPFSFEL